MTSTLIIPPVSLTWEKFNRMPRFVTCGEFFVLMKRKGGTVCSAQLSRKLYMVRTTDDVRQPTTNHPGELTAKGH